MTLSQLSFDSKFARDALTFSGVIPPNVLATPRDEFVELIIVGETGARDDDQHAVVRDLPRGNVIDTERKRKANHVGLLKRCVGTGEDTNFILAYIQKMSNDKRSSECHNRSMYVVYILLCKNNSLYTGITTDVPRRLLEHERGTGARYTRAHGVKKLLHTERKMNRSTASKREAEIKRLTREQKLLLIAEAKKKNWTRSMKKTRIKK